MKQFYVYLHFRAVGTVFYVGKGTGKRSHDFSRRNKHHERIVAKDGKQNIEVLVFPRNTEQQAFSDEVKWIRVLREAEFDLCNQTGGGEGLSNITDELRERIAKTATGKIPSLETRAKMSASRIGNSNSLGKKLPPFTEEHRAKIGAVHKGKTVSVETRGKLAETSRGNKNCVGRKIRGWKQSEETRSRMSEIRKAWWAEQKRAASGSA